MVLAPNSIPTVISYSSEKVLFRNWLRMHDLPTLGLPMMMYLKTYLKWALLIDYNFD